MRLTRWGSNDQTWTGPALLLGHSWIAEKAGRLWIQHPKGAPSLAPDLS